MMARDVAPAQSNTESNGEADVLSRRVGSEAILRLRLAFVGFVGDTADVALTS